MPTLLSPHFTQEEFQRSETAQRAGLSNVMPLEAIHAAQALCQHVLEPARSVLGSPIAITSGYRAPIVNWLVRHPGKPIPHTLPPGGQHPLGEAADCYPTDASLVDLWSAITKWTKYDQIIWEFGGWIHVSYGSRMRGEQLVAFHDARGMAAYREPDTQDAFYNV